MGAPDQKIILRCFFEHTLIYLCVKFQVGLTCPTGFLPTSATFFTNIWREYFSPNLLRVFDQPEVEFLKSGQNWANTRPLLLKTFESSNCVDRHIVQCVTWISLARLGTSYFLLIWSLSSTQKLFQWVSSMKRGIWIISPPLTICGYQIFPDKLENTQITPFGSNNVHIMWELGYGCKLAFWQFLCQHRSLLHIRPEELVTCITSPTFMYLLLLAPANNFKKEYRYHQESVTFNWFRSV